jgi:acyl-CoA synthetase (AMP-forming)/AMP-acid ligase II
MRAEQVLRKSAALYGEAAAIVADRAAYSFADLDMKSDRLAAAFAGRGLAAGDRVCVYLDAGPPAVMTAFATWKAGAVLCPIEVVAGSSAFAGLLRGRSADCLVTEARYALRAATALRESQGTKLVVIANTWRSLQGNCLSFEDALACGGDAPVHTETADDIAMIIGAAGLAFSHAELLEGLSECDPEQAPAAVSVATFGGMARLLSSVGAGVTQIIDTSTSGRSAGLGAADYLEIRLSGA